ncbi:MAG: hypothetical protein MUO72_05325 [Bacteroidales bacterium]|nr:hypothetical protein [Bacteroidales bacterium]
MRLAITAKYLFLKGRNSTILCITLISFLLHSNLKAQTYKLTFQNTKLSEALLQSSKELDIKVAFDSDKLSAITIDKEVIGNTVDEFMTNLLSNTGFEFKSRYDRYLILDLKGNDENSLYNECQIIGFKFFLSVG